MERSGSRRTFFAFSDEVQRRLSRGIYPLSADFDARFWFWWFLLGDVLIAGNLPCFASNLGHVMRLCDCTTRRPFQTAKSVIYQLLQQAPPPHFDRALPASSPDTQEFGLCW